MEGPFNGNGDDGGGGADGGICGALLSAFCAAFCKDNPLAESLGLNQPDANGGGQQPHQPARGGGHPDNGGGGGGGGGNRPGFATYGDGGFAPPDGIQLYPVAPVAPAAPVTPQPQSKNNSGLNLPLSQCAFGLCVCRVSSEGNNKKQWTNELRRALNCYITITHTPSISKHTNTLRTPYIMHNFPRSLSVNCTHNLIHLEISFTYLHEHLVGHVDDILCKDLSFGAYVLES